MTSRSFLFHLPQSLNPFSSIWLGEGNGTPLQYSCLENPMDGGAWCAAVHGVAKSQRRLSDFIFTHGADNGKRMASLIPLTWLYKV